MTPELTKLIVAGVVALAIGVFIALGTNHYMSLREAAAQNETRGNVIKGTAGIIKDGERVDAAQQRVEIAITDGRERYAQDYDRETDNDQAFADRADRAVDQRVRDLARQRRIARERSARDDAGSSQRAAEKELGER